MANVSSSNGIEKYPKLRFPEFTEPWRDIKLSDVSSYRNKRTTVSKVKYVSTENMLQNYAGLEPYTEDIETDGIAIFCNDTLLANIRPYLKKVLKSEFNGACSTDVLAFSPEQINPDFLYSLIAQDKFIDYVMSGAKGSKMPRGDKSHIMDYATSIPTEEEQQKISSFVELINNRIAAQTYYIELLKKYKRGVSKRFFDEIHNDQNCEAKQFSEVFELIQNNTFSRECLTDENTDVLNVHYGDILVKYGSVLDPDIDTVPFIKSGTDLSKFSSSSYLQDGDVIFADTAEDYTVGKMCEIINVSNRKILSGLHTMPFRPTITFAPMYLGYYLNSAAFRTQILPMIQGAKVSSISKSEMKKTIIHIPSIERQTEIVSILNALDKRIKRTELILAELKEMKKGLLQNLFI